MRNLLVAALFVVGPAVLAHADGTEDHAKADTIFEEAQQLKQAGKTAEACAKYDEALKYNRNAVGTLLNVGKCNEDAGRVASAVKHYSQARDLAREHNLNEHRTAAEERLAATAPRVPRLAIAFTERPDNMKLVIDDMVYPTDIESTSELRLDPGKRHIVVTAPGRVPFDTYVELVEGKQAAVAIPNLAYPVTVKKARKTVGKVLTFSGVGLVGTGLLLGYFANSQYEKEFDAGRCMEVPNMTPLCNSEGHTATNSARQLGTVGTVVGGVGVLALGVGVFLWVTAPSERENEIASERSGSAGSRSVAEGRRGVLIVPSLTPESAGLAAVGRF